VSDDDVRENSISVCSFISADKWHSSGSSFVAISILYMHDSRWDFMKGHANLPLINILGVT
jgi:hypothetical protein